jgi:hypothetical protein
MQISRKMSRMAGPFIVSKLDVCVWVIATFISVFHLSECQGIKSGIKLVAVWIYQSK